VKLRLIFTTTASAEPTVSTRASTRGKDRDARAMPMTSPAAATQNRAAKKAYIQMGSRTFIHPKFPTKEVERCNGNS
jgi:hypothetical protein